MTAWDHFCEADMKDVGVVNQRQINTGEVLDNNSQQLLKRVVAR